MNIHTDLKRLFFNLNATNPIVALSNIHVQKTDSWFDMHYECEIGIVVKGQMKRHYLSHDTIMGPGDVWFCGMWEPHGFELLEAPCEVLVLVIDPDFILKSNYFDFEIFPAFQSEPALRPTTPFEHKEKMLQLGEKAKKKLVGHTNPNWSKTLFFELILLVLETWKPPKNTSNKNPNILTIQPALFLIFTEKKLISTSEAAAVCKMSISTFRATFKEFMNMPFSDFALRYRIKSAHAALQHSRETQEKIALEWGFTDASHLQRHIKRIKEETSFNY